MSNPYCPVGQTRYKDICVPTYFSALQKEEAYLEHLRNKEASGKGKVVVLAGFAAALLLVALYLANGFWL